MRRAKETFRIACILLPSHLCQGDKGNVLMFDSKVEHCYPNPISYNLDQKLHHTRRLSALLFDTNNEQKAEGIFQLRERKVDISAGFESST